MEFAYKDLTFDGNKFMIKYLIKVDDYELEASKGKIIISVFYYPNSLMTLFDSENILNRYLNLLKEEIIIIVNEHKNFYNGFESDYNFTEFGSSGGYDDFGREGSSDAHAIMYFKNKVEYL